MLIFEVEPNTQIVAKMPPNDEFNKNTYEAERSKNKPRYRCVDQAGSLQKTEVAIYVIEASVHEFAVESVGEGIDLRENSALHDISEIITDCVESVCLSGVNILGIGDQLIVHVINVLYPLSPGAVCRRSVAGNSSTGINRYGNRVALECVCQDLDFPIHDDFERMCQGEVRWV